MLQGKGFVLSLDGLGFSKLFRNGNQLGPQASYKVSPFAPQGHNLCGISSIVVSLLQFKACSIPSKLFIWLPTCYPRSAGQT